MPNIMRKCPVHLQLEPPPLYGILVPTEPPRTNVDRRRTQQIVKQMPLLAQIYADIRKRA